MNEENKVTSKSALAIQKNSDGKYQLVKVAYNPEDSNVEVLLTDVREDVIDRFKMTAADLFMGDL